ncbi:MAG TPA: hypothetical protein DDY16_08690 [Tenacibaculum sp.]|nr:hypothetical protein [Tenacibaculum sp.]
MIYYFFSKKKKKKESSQSKYVYMHKGRCTKFEKWMFDNLNVHNLIWKKIRNQHSKIHSSKIGV